MNANKQIQDLLQKRMDRKNFLKHVGIGVMALTGLSGALKLLQGSQSTGSQGYGSSAYGGGQPSGNLRIK